MPQKGQKHTEETIKKLKESHLGQIPWNKGIPRTDIEKKKMSDGHKRNGIKSTLGKHWKVKDTSRMKNRKYTEEDRRKRSENSRGDKNPNWKGGISSLNVQIRQSLKYRQWISDVFTTQDFVCQDCGKRGGNLNAHHIKSFIDIIKDNEITTLEQALNCDELWNINNGKTLCKSCHINSENYGWKKYNLKYARKK